MENNVVKVIIIDDEYLIRNLLKKCIDWESIGMEIVGEAANATDAIELVAKYLPDVIFTDICMPEIDGIQFSEIIIKKYPNIKVIILTGYDDFSYAQRSIRAGITDFLLKPIDDEEVMKTALKLKLIIKEERAKSEEYIELKIHLNENLPYLEEKFLNELLKGVSDLKTTTEKMAYLGFDFGINCFHIAIIEVIDHLEDISAKEEQRQNHRAIILNIVQEYFSPNKSVIVFFDINHRIIILSNNENTNLARCSEELKMIFKDTTDFSFCIGIGNDKKRIEDICISYKEALNAVNYRVVAGNNTVIQFNEVHFSNNNGLHVENNMYIKLSFCIKAGIKEKAKETIQSFYENIDLKEDAAVSSLRIVALNIIYINLRILNEMGINIKDVYSTESEPYNKVFTIDTLPEIIEYLNSNAMTTIKIINQHQVKNKSGNKTINDILNYLVENMGDENLSLSGISKVFFLNPSYFSRMFLKEAGINFKEYLIKIRIEKAVKLLRETEMKAYEIAESIGIPDSNYFSTCFKKYIGVSVSEYKKSNSEFPC